VFQGLKEYSGPVKGRTELWPRTCVCGSYIDQKITTGCCGLRATNIDLSMVELHYWSTWWPCITTVCFYLFVAYVPPFLRLSKFVREMGTLVTVVTTGELEFHYRRVWGVFSLPPCMLFGPRREAVFSRCERGGQLSIQYHLDEICALLGYYAASSGSSVRTFRSNLSFPIFKGRDGTLRLSRNVGTKQPLDAA
jgi:hypothetical protein